MDRIEMRIGSPGWRSEFRLNGLLLPVTKAMIECDPMEETHVRLDLVNPDGTVDQITGFLLSDQDAKSVGQLTMAVSFLLSALTDKVDGFGVEHPGVRVPAELEELVGELRQAFEEASGRRFSQLVTVGY